MGWPIGVARRNGSGPRASRTRSRLTNYFGGLEAGSGQPAGEGQQQQAAPTTRRRLLLFLLGCVLHARRCIGTMMTHLRSKCTRQFWKIAHPYFIITTYLVINPNQSLESVASPIHVQRNFIIFVWIWSILSFFLRAWIYSTLIGIFSYGVLLYKKIYFINGVSFVISLLRFSFFE